MRRSLIILLFLTVATPGMAQQASPFIGLRIDSKSLGESRQMLVRLPASYRTGVKSYPVLYMTDGDAHIRHTNTLMEYLVLNNRMPEMIIVGITNTDRTRDLSPTHIETRPTSGGADKFLDFIQNELIPTVEKNYRTQPYRVFAGHSLGGLLVMHTLFTRPTLFNSWIAISPVLTWDNDIVNKRAAEFVRSESRTLNGVLVVTIGEENRDLDREFDELKAIMRSRKPKGLEFAAQKFGDEDHGSVVLPSHYFGLRQIFDSWRFPLNAATDPRLLPAQVRDHYAKLSARVGYSIPIPEDTMNLIGYRLLDANLLGQAIEVLQANADAYPSSPNAYDSLGEAWERRGDLAKAKENYERAATLARDTNDPNAAAFAQNRDRVTAALAKRGS
jgi:uncharacterized protein